MADEKEDEVLWDDIEKVLKETEFDNDLDEKPDELGTLGRGDQAVPVGEGWPACTTKDLDGPNPYEGFSMGDDDGRADDMRCSGCGLPLDSGCTCINCDPRRPPSVGEEVATVNGELRPVNANNDSFADALNHISNMPLKCDTLLTHREDYAEMLRFAGVPEEEIQRRLEVIEEDLGEVPVYAGPIFTKHEDKE